MRTLPGVHVFGFTTWPRDSEIGALIEAESLKWERFRIRFSGDPGPRGATVIDPPAWGWTTNGVVCPAQAHRSDISCGSCGFCVKSTKPVVFARHWAGRSLGRREHTSERPNRISESILAFSLEPVGSCPGRRSPRCLCPRSKIDPRVYDSGGYAGIAEKLVGDFQHSDIRPCKHSNASRPPIG